VNTAQKYSDNQEENEKLLSENAELKKKLEVEEFHHKTLYRQWSELNSRMLATEREFDRFKTKNIFYKYAFFFILLSIIPAYYLISKTKGDEKTAPVTQTDSPQPTKQIPIAKDTPIVSQAPELNETVASNADTVKPLIVKPREKELIKPDTIQKTITINKPTINKPVIAEEPLSDAGRDSVYWQGWNGYYKKLRNPYRRSSEKFTLWLQGWKDGENDSKKLSAQDSLNR